MIIFDLDGTVIDSSHRQLTLADGSLDLDHWIENCTRQKVLADRLLPLSRYWHTLLQHDEKPIICTARVMGEADFEFLKINGLEFEHCFSRTAGDHTGDALLKVQQLGPLAREQKMVMFDDNVRVRKALTQIGILCIDPVPLNRSFVA